MIQVRGDDRLRATALVMRELERPLVNEINRQTRATLNPLWQGLVEVHATSPQDSRILGKGARIKPGNPPVAQAATSRRALKGGLVPNQDYAAFEFGANREATRTYTRRSKNGGSHKVTRHTRKQLPPRIRKGRVVMPAFATFAPRAVSLWVQTVVRTVYEGLERAQ